MFNFTKKHGIRKELLEKVRTISDITPQKIEDEVKNDGRETILELNDRLFKKYGSGAVEAFFETYWVYMKPETQRWLASHFLIESLRSHHTKK